MRLKGKTPRKRLERKLDDLFRQAVYLRDGNVCQVCGKGPLDRVECSHFVGRRNRSTRWDLYNADAKCHACHRFMGENPGIFSDWKRKRLGSEEYDALILRGNQSWKWTLGELESLVESLQDFIQRINDSR